MSVSSSILISYKEPINEYDVINKKYLDKVMPPNNSDVFNKVSKACKTINIEGSGSGSGCFISFDQNDLQYGLFLTAAHCVYPSINTVYVTNPITNKWKRISVDYTENTGNVFYDGVADIAIIKTNINFSRNPEYCLKLSNKNPRIGDMCYICGDPLGLDTMSFSEGIIRDNHYSDYEGAQAVDSLLTTASSFTGNSGSPILNTDGDIIGIFTFTKIVNTFGFISQAGTIGGGSNLDVLNKSLPILRTFKSNKNKKYLGLKWEVARSSLLYNIYNLEEFDNKGVRITNISSESPFFNKLKIGDILLSTSYNNKNVDFGVLLEQRTPGILIYEYDFNEISISYIDSSDKKIKNTIITLSKTYANSPGSNDMYLSGGM